MKFDMKKCVVGITGLACSGLQKAACALQNSIGNKETKIVDLEKIRKHPFNMEKDSFSYQDCFSDVCKALSEYETVIITGQHLQLLFPALDLLFILETKEFNAFE